MKTLENLWYAFNHQDVDTFKHCAEALVEHGGIDVVHIAGLTLVDAGFIDQGMILLKAATIFRPKSRHIYTNGAFAAEKADRPADLRFIVEAGLKDFIDDPDLLLLQGNGLMMELRFDDAREVYEHLIELDPTHIRAMCNAGNSYRAMDRFDEAERMFERVDTINKHYFDVAIGRATMYSQMGGVEATDKAIKILSAMPGDDNAKFLLALLYMAKGDYERGFRLYRDRGKAMWYKNQVPLRPMDHFSEAKDKTVAVVQEGGLGDSLMYLRYVQMLALTAKEVTMVVSPTLVRLMKANVPANVIVTSSVEDNETFDYVTTDVELPYHYRTTIGSIPTGGIPYVQISQDMREHHVLKTTGKKRVGICWSGGVREGLNERGYDERRSIQYADLNPLASDAVEFVSLQFNPGAGLPGLPPEYDMYDTAAIIDQLDLVITVDTSIVHLAGAMGKQVWLLSRLDCCWRWLFNRPQSIWYPNVRVFGQDEYRDWEAPLIQMAQALREFIATE